jgi:RNA-directed DNA polymerase
VLEGDIEACFDRISHEWLLENVPMDKAILKAWLKAGYLRDARFYPTEEGTPQGGIISPVLANLALDGLEQTVRHAAPRRSKVNVVRYADDFIITGNSRELLEDKILPAVTGFLAERGLRISSEKTAITHIEQGFDFLGANIRKYGGKLRMKPAAQTARRFLQDIRRYLRSHRSIAAADLISALNPKIRGWAYQFRHLVAFRVFEQIDNQIHDSLWRWVRRQHPQKSVRWIYSRYYRRSGNRRWVFSARIRPANGDARVIDLFRASSLPIIRYVKVRGAATVFDPRYDAYFHQRRLRRRELRGPRPFIDPTF